MVECEFSEFLKGTSFLGGRNSIGGAHGRRNSKRDDDGAEPNLIAVVQPARSGHPFFADVSAVLASKIFEDRVLSFEHEPRVVP